jgi:hypothetical protein
MSELGPRPERLTASILSPQYLSNRKRLLVGRWTWGGDHQICVRYHGRVAFLHSVCKARTRLPRAAGHSPSLAKSRPALGLIPCWCRHPRDGLLDRLVVQVSTLSSSFFNPYLSFFLRLV